MTERAYFALMAEYLAQLERAVREHGGKIHGVPLRRESQDEKYRQLCDEHYEQWAKRQVDAIFDQKEGDREKPA